MSLFNNFPKVTFFLFSDNPRRYIFDIFAGMKRIAVLLAATFAAVSCHPGADLSWTENELSLISSRAETMRVLTVADSADSLVLRSPSVFLTQDDIRSKEYALLASKMVATVTSPEQDGVGIAGPQVGILRRVVAVQRFDKDGKPFEVYPNICIRALYGETEEGPEGCLSVPGLRGLVPRYRDIEISYTSPATALDTTERVTGFTAVIFQHEIDHLVGTIYTDRATSVSAK